MNLIKIDSMIINLDNVTDVNKKPDGTIAIDLIVSVGDNNEQEGFSWSKYDSLYPQALAAYEWLTIACVFDANNPPIDPYTKGQQAYERIKAEITQADSNESEAAPETIHLSAVEIETLDTIIECEPTPDDYAGTDEYYAKEALLSIGFIRKDSAEMLHATDTGKQWLANNAPETVAGETDSRLYKRYNGGSQLWDIWNLDGSKIWTGLREHEADTVLEVVSTETASLRATIASKDAQIAALEAENERLREIGDVTSLDWNQKVAELEESLETSQSFMHKAWAKVGNLESALQDLLVVAELEIGDQDSDAISRAKSLLQGYTD